MFGWLFVVGLFTGWFGLMFDRFCLVWFGLLFGCVVMLFDFVLGWANNFSDLCCGITLCCWVGLVGLNVVGLG